MVTIFPLPRVDNEIERGCRNTALAVRLRNDGISDLPQGSGAHG